MTGQTAQGAMTLTEKGRAGIEGSLEQVRQSGGRLRELSEVVRSSNAGARQIAIVVSQQHEGIAQIFTAVTELSTSMDRTKASLEGIRTSVTQLERVNAQIAETVGRFRL